MKYKAAIFDFNGTLIWDTKFHNQALDIFMKKYNIEMNDQEKRQKIHGKSSREIMMALFKLDYSNEEAAVLALEKELLYQKLCIDELCFAPGAENILTFLKSNNIPYCIATSSEKSNIDFYFENMNLGKWFERNMVIFNDGTLLSKPNPDLFLVAAERIMTKPSEIVIFEDSIAGIKAAENACAGKIVIVNSTNEDFSNYSHETITNFEQVDRNLFV